MVNHNNNDKSQGGDDDDKIDFTSRWVKSYDKQDEKTDSYLVKLILWHPLTSEITNLYSLI